MVAKTKTLMRLKCSVCDRANYYFEKKRTAEKKLQLKKFCKWCRKHTAHKEARK